MEDADSTLFLQTTQPVEEEQTQSSISEEIATWFVIIFGFTYLIYKIWRLIVKLRDGDFGSGSGSSSSSSRSYNHSSRSSSRGSRSWGGGSSSGGGAGGKW